MDGPQGPRQTEETHQTIRPLNASLWPRFAYLANQSSQSLRRCCSVVATCGGICTPFRRGAGAGADAAIPSHKAAVNGKYRV